jgi:hypothetical protein
MNLNMLRININYKESGWALATILVFLDRFQAVFLIRSQFVNN